MGKIIKRAIGKVLVKRHGFWFVDIPRTSSSSIRSELGQQYGRAHGKRKVEQKQFAGKQLFSDHLTALQMRSIMGEDNWKRLYTFSMVRSPWDRIHSLYRYRKKISANIPEQWTFSDFVEALVEADENSEYFKLPAYRLGAVDYVTDENRQIIVNDIARFENRDEELQKIAERIQCPVLGNRVVQYAAPKGKSYVEVYSDKNRDLIAERYADDIQLFGYGFGE